MNFSLEISPKTDLDTLPPVNDVYVTMLPGGDYKETADKSVELVKKGFNPVPHFPARSCLLYTSPSPRDATLSRMPSSA